MEEGEEEKEREKEKKMEILFTSAVTSCIFFSRRGGHVQLAISRPEKSSKDLYLMKNMVMHAALYSIPFSLSFPPSHQDGVAFPQDF